MIGKIFLVSTALAIATSAGAFSGIGIGPLQRHKSKSGVDAIGVHIDSSGKKANIDIVDGDSQEESCLEGVKKDRFGNCNICENGNIYLPYNKGAECDTETPLTEDCASLCAVNWDEESDCIEVCISDGATPCHSNIECADNEFCNLMSNEDNCEKPNTGVCMQIGNFTEIETPIGNLRKSDKAMSWWAANNWCQVQGKSLLDIEDMGCFMHCQGWNENWDAEVEFFSGELVTAGSEYNCGCCAEDAEECRWKDPGGDDEFTSPLYKRFIEKFGNFQFWMRSDFSSTDICRAFVVHRNDDQDAYAVEGTRRDNRNHYALCK